MRKLLIIFTILIFAGLGFALETRAASCDTDTNACSGADCSNCCSVTLTWTAFTQSDLNSIHPGTTLQSVSYTVTVTGVSSQTVSGTSASFSGLAGNTTYTWSVTANYIYSGVSDSANTGTSYTFKTPVCIPPLADAGPDKEVLEGESVVLEGSWALDCSVYGCAEPDGLGGCQPKPADEYGLSVCQRCDGVSLSPVNFAAGSQDTEGSNTCTVTHYRCDGAGNCTAPTTPVCSACGAATVTCTTQCASYIGCLGAYTSTSCTGGTTATCSINCRNVATYKSCSCSTYLYD